METNINKQIVSACYKCVIRDLNFSLVDTYIADDYIQHSPTVKDGKQGLLEMLRFLETIPKPATQHQSPIIRMIAEGDLVAVHLDIIFMGKRVAVVDLFRLNNGKIAEHWDAAIDQPVEQPGPVTFTNGATVIDKNADAIKSKELVKSYYESVVNNKKPADLSKFIDGNYVEHTPGRRLSDQELQATRIHRIISEGNFVVTHCECILNGSLMSEFHIFRIEDNIIAEHWSVKQYVPEKMANDNGMF